MDPSSAMKYNRVAQALGRSARDLCEVAEDGDLYGNAIAIVAIHAAIAHSDALTIAFGGFKSTEGDHLRAGDALLAALGSRADPGKIKLLRSIISEKDTVSCQGVYYTVEDAQAVVGRLMEFADWADAMYQQRP
ncbi:MAG: hypothetical protein EA352_02115 [Gemmatimonadales bacterium]|nr:MAG: hypothetical protein EA352_02115 [Gemmatimonadales bacterium]